LSEFEVLMHNADTFAFRIIRTVSLLCGPSSS
jgi:hypothetical protein